MFGIQEQIISKAKSRHWEPTSMGLGFQSQWKRHSKSIDKMEIIGRVMLSKGNRNCTDNQGKNRTKEVRNGKVLRLTGSQEIVCHLVFGAKVDLT